MLSKCSEWPRVLPDDNGIRQAGQPNQCFYCGACVGQQHKHSCVCVLRKVKYQVLAKLGYGQDVSCGIYVHAQPHHWDDYDGEFHLNESSWCADNAVDSIRWLETEEAQAAKTLVTSLPEDSCSCGILSFVYIGVIDEGPFIELRGQQQDAPTT